MATRISKRIIKEIRMKEMIGSMNFGTRASLVSRAVNWAHTGVASKGMASVLAMLVLLVFASSSFASGASSDMMESVGKESDDLVNRLGCGLRGTFGYFIIGFGVVLALWEYFVQKQGHLIVVAIIGVLGVIILGRILPCDGA